MSATTLTTLPSATIAEFNNAVIRGQAAAVRVLTGLIEACTDPLELRRLAALLIRVRQIPDPNAPPGPSRSRRPCRNSVNQAPSTVDLTNSGIDKGDTADLPELIAQAQALLQAFDRVPHNPQMRATGHQAPADPSETLGLAAINLAVRTPFAPPLPPALLPRRARQPSPSTLMQAAASATPHHDLVNSS